MIGARVKQARLATGLSQQQLAGKELSRSFICRLEKNQVRPSLATLELLARRLGKPIEYFTGPSSREEELIAAVQVMLRAAERALDAGDGPAALEGATKARRLCDHFVLGDAQLQAELLMIRAYEKLGRYEEAVELGEETADRCRTLDLPGPLALVHTHLGNLYFRKADFATARRHYLRVLRNTAGRKSLMEQEARVLINLGSCYVRLGELNEAADAYRQALEICGLGVSADLTGLARLGLGWALYQQGQSEEALEVTLDARRMLEALSHPAVVYARHNQAVIEADLNRGEGTLGLLQGCLQEYEAQQDLRSQASVLEELARYHLQHGSPAAADECCQRALSILDQHDDSLLRGRLYRKAAVIQQALGNLQRARDLALLSLELFRQLQASREWTATRTFLDQLSAP